LNNQAHLWVLLLNGFALFGAEWHPIVGWNFFFAQDTYLQVFHSLVHLG
jgi:hypothetical protein